MIAELTSVVIPVRDGAAFLPRAIASVRRQAGVQLELVVVDDASRDGSADLAAKLGADRVVALPVNAGVASARNVGFAVSRGEYVCFHDADDEMLPGKLHAQLRHLANVPADGGVTVDQLITLTPGVAAPPWLAGRPALRGEPSPVATSALLRSAVLVLCGGFDPAMSVCEDVELYHRMRVAGRPVGHVPIAYLRRLIHGANASSALDPRDGWLRVARAATAQRRQPPPDVCHVAADAGPFWGAAVARNIAVLNTRSPTLTFASETAAAPAAELLRGNPATDVVAARSPDTPPLAIRRAALARAGLWQDRPEAESCALWWQAARDARLTVGVLPRTPA
jgi:GT2 family glycosyltransferase